MNHNLKIGRQRGVSLLEVLITIVIVSFGLLGVAGIIVNGMKSNMNSYGRTQATLLAQDMIERMRANRVAAESAALPYNMGLADATPAATTVPTSDLAGWRGALAAALPSGTGSVTLDRVTRLVTITVQWNASRTEGGSSTEQIIVRTQL